MVLRRALSGVLGFLGAAAGVAILYATIRSFVEPSPLWLNVATDFAGLAIGSAVVVLGFRYLRYAYTNRLTMGAFSKSYVTGVGCFFPGALVSLPFTIYWANHAWPGDGQSVLAAMAVSVCIGVLSTIGYWAVAILKSAQQRVARPTPR